MLSIVSLIFQFYALNCIDLLLALVERSLSNTQCIFLAIPVECPWHSELAMHQEPLWMDDDGCVSL